MKFKILMLLLLMLPVTMRSVARECKKTIVVAIIDTGFGYQDRGHEANLCRYGHKDFSIDRQFTHAYDTHDLVPLDLNKHGTNVTGIINNYAKQVGIDYCLVVIKYYSEHQFWSQNFRAEVNAINYATAIHADYINLSSSGSEGIESEKTAVEKFLDGGGKFVTVAGNNGENLDLLNNNVYPGMYDDRIVVVGNGSAPNERDVSSNYGNVVNRWEVGKNVTAYGITLSGTSMSAATATGKLVAQKLKTCDSR